jgi:hypothetical protein
MRAQLACVALALSGCVDWGGLSAGCPKDVLACDDFEDPALPGWDRRGAGTLAQDTTRARFGTGSLHVHLDGVTSGSQSAELSRTLVLPARLYARAYLSIGPANTNPYVSHVLYVSSNNGDGLELENNSKQVGFWEELKNQQVDVVAPELPDGWFCLEWSVDVTAGSTSIAVDGAPIATVPVVLGQPDVFALGAYTEKAGGYDAWFDNLIVDANPIGCSK